MSDHNTRPVWKDSVAKNDHREKITNLIVSGCDNYKAAEQIIDSICDLIHMEDTLDISQAAGLVVQIQLCMLKAKDAFLKSERPEIDYDDIPF